MAGDRRPESVYTKPQRRELMPLPEMEQAPIEPAYWQQHASETLSLGRVALECRLDEVVYSFSADAALVFRPEAHLFFDVVPDDIPPIVAAKLIMPHMWDGKLRMVDRGVEFDGMCVSVGECVRFAPRVSMVSATGSTSSLSRAVCSSIPMVARGPYWWTRIGAMTRVSQMR